MRLSKWHSSALLAFEFILSVLQLFDAFHVWYFPMIHRMAYSLRFELGFSLVPALLPVPSIITVFLMKGGKYREILITAFISLALYPLFGLEASVAIFGLIQLMWAIFYFVDFGDFLFWLLVLMTGFEAIALIHWVLLPFGVVSPLAWFANLELSLFYILAQLAPLTILFTFFIVFIKLLNIRLEIGVQFSNSYLNSILARARMMWKKLDVRRVEPSGRFSIITVIFLVFTLFLSVAAALYPYSPIINPESVNVGVDIPHYVWDAKIVEKNVFLAFEAWNRTRPMIFITIYGFQRLIGTDVLTAVRFLPMLLNPLMALSAFFLAWEVFSDGWAGAWAAFFTICGFQVAVGMYSYFLTNMLGLCLVYSSLGFLFRAIRQDSRICLVIASLLGGFLVFTHPWTFVQYFTVAVLTAIILLYDIRSKGGDMRRFVTMSVYIVSITLTDLLKVLVFHGLGVTSASSLAISGISGLLGFWSSSITVFRILYGGLMSNLALLSLAIGGIYLIGHRNVPEIYFRIFLIITSLIFLISDETNKSRLLYNIPIGLFSASGFFSLLKSRERTKYMFASFVILSIVVYLFRSLANLV